MDCSKCHKPNRPSAKYCKWCGTPVAAAATAATATSGGSPLDSLVGKDTAVALLKDVLTSASNIAAQGRARGTEMRRDLCFAITGAPGTGKNVTAEALTAALAAAGIIKKPVPTVVKAIDYAKFVEKLADNIKPVGGNVLIIDDAQKHSPTTRADSLCELEKILAYCDDWGPDPEKPVVIFLGDDDLLKFFENNPSARAKIKEMISLNAPDIPDLVEICARRLEQVWHSKPLEAGVRAKIGRVITHAKRSNPDTFPNGHYAHNLADRIYEAYCNSGATDGIITPAMVVGKEYIPKTLDDVMRDFDKYVGVEDIKEQIRLIALGVEDARKRGGDAAAAGSVKSHFVFVGNPGTGKTTMARLFAEALSAMGALPSGHLVETDRGKLVSQYVGDTPKLVRKAVNDAMGGVLFIDEAYELCRDENDSYGNQAIATLLKDCEDLRGKFVCLLAGYPVEMQRMLGANPGLQSRFNKTITFRDYTGPELTQIFRNMAAGGDDPVKLDAEADAQIGAFFDKMYATRTARFGNARNVRNVLDEARGRMKERLDRAAAGGTPVSEPMLTMRDIEGENATKAVDDILASFDDLVGMEDVKQQISTIAKRVRLNRRRMAAGRGKVMVDNIHIIITGNPGTGKTTVAKRLGKVFKAIGAIPTDKVIIKERKDILDSYANSAGKNMQKAVDDAMGGILFIDEAYNLMPVGQPGTVDSTGAEAVDALMTCMSERAGQFITVIAGYKDKMDEFIRNANPGLQRRFTHSIHIPDYSVDDLLTIYALQARTYGCTLTDEAYDLLQRKVEEMVSAKDEKFGNAGEMVKLFEKTLERQSERLSDMADDDNEDALYTIEAADIPYDAPKKLDIDEIMGRLDHLEGLAEVKKAVRDMADTLQAMQMREQATGVRGGINLDHYLFLGNPGTGKTTVARIMGDIFYSLGLLPSNKVVELSAKDLKGVHVGETAPKTHAALMRGMGGVVFIDEAYSITQGDGNVGYGIEAVAELLQVMENYKNKFICIAAGYPREMSQWLDSNSGLSSRFTTTINFADYNAAELTHIAEGIFTKKNLRITDDARQAMLFYFTRLVNARSANFANAREARNYVDKVILNQGRRLRAEMRMPDFDTNRAFVIEAPDMQID